MFYVLRKTPTTSGSGYGPTQNPDIDPTKVRYWHDLAYTETRIGRRFVKVEAAKALAKRHLGRVIDMNSSREVANYG